MLFTSLSANGQHQGFTHLINLDFDAVREIQPSDNKALDLYYVNLADALEIILLEDESRYQSLSNNKSNRLELLDDTEEQTAWHGFVEAEIKLQWAFINFKKGKEWDAFWGLRSAYKSIKRNNQRYPDFEPNKKTLGLLNVIFGIVPGKNQWLMNLFGLKGDLFEGIALLDSLTDSYPQFRLEANLMLGMVQAYLLEDFDKAMNTIDAIGYEQTSLVNYVKALVNLKAHNSTDARNLLVNSNNPIPLFNYMIGETYFQSGDYSKATTHFIGFLEEFKGQTYIKDAYLKLALSHLFMNQPELYQSYLALSREQGEASSEIDQNAVKILDNLQNQNVTTLQIRFAIDGGFYDQAYKKMAAFENNDLTTYEALELAYRKARMYHLMKNNDQAINYYRQVIESADAISESYYAPNAFLQLGYLMRSQGDQESAAMYFERVLKFKKHPYKSSLDGKAKIALKSLSLSGD